MTLLHFQENLLPVEEIEDQPAGEEVECLRDELVPVTVKQFDDAAEEETTRPGAVDDSWQHVDGDGIHADDLEEESPTAPASYVDDVIKQREADERIARHGADEGTGPELFVDREDKAPQPANQCERHTSQKYIESLFVAGDFCAADPLACEHAQHGGDDGRKRAEQAFRIEGFLIEMLFGYQGAVDDADQIVFEGERIGAVRYEPHGQPVTDEYDSRDRDKN